MAVHVGDRGVAESPLYLTGAVRINGVRLGARSDRGPVEAGTAVVVVGDDPLGLVVRPVVAGSETEQLPDHGRQVFTSPQERAAAAEERLEAEVQRNWAVHRRRGIVFAAVAGALAAGLALWFLWGRIDRPSLSPEAFAAAVVAAGALWGALVFRVVDGALGVVNPEYRQLSNVSAYLGLAGTALGAAFGIPWGGLGVGLAVAAIATVFLAAAIPGVLIAVGG
jgi:hypothetical protein